MRFDGKAFGAEIVGAVKAHVAEVLAPIAVRLDALEKQVAVLPTPKDGKDADEEAVAARVAKKVSGEIAELRKSIDAIPEPALPDICSMVADVVAAIPAPKDGKSVDPDEVRAMVADSVERAVAAIPVPKDGKDGKDGDRGVGAAGAMIDRDGNLVITLSDGKTQSLGRVVGRSVTEAEIEKLVTTAVAKMPKPKDGVSVTIEDVAPLVADAVKSAVAALPAPHDGKDGKNGKDGRDGADADPEAIKDIVCDVVAREMANISLPKDGKDGKDGRDGFSLEKFDASLMDDERTLLLSFEDGELAFAVEVPLHIPIVRGPHEPGREYQRGDMVTFEGGLWHCERPSRDAPKHGSRTWVQVLEPARDGRDGVDVKDMLVSESGELVATFTDGRTKELGRFRGEDGKDGKDGAAGLGFDDMDVEHDGERRLVLRFKRGDRVKEFELTIPAVIDRGVWQAGSYDKGDGVTHGGSFWIATEDTTDKPGEGAGWRLAVKRGRDAGEPVKIRGGK